ncbi:MAG: hypothetical protein G8D91_00370 [gamma proteobacterium symbiont of Clathrolucina costata]
MIKKITNALQNVIDAYTVFLALCVAAWLTLASPQDVADHGDMALTALFIALAGLASMNMIKVVINALMRKEAA